MKKLFKIIGKLILILGTVYAALFVVFFFDLDGKALFKFVEPALCKHYDGMERRDPLKAPYDMNKPHYEYDTKEKLD